jgi:inosine-uridine nucleoside N-ribohydrolase
LSPPEAWKALFKPSSSQSSGIADGDLKPELNSLYTPSLRPSHLEILRLLDENPPDTISIIAIGPLTNLALAASESPKSFMRAKSVLIMGGAIGVPGNITPLAEFNTYADATAAARLYALTSPDPTSTFPPRAPSIPHKTIAGNSATEVLRTSLPSYPPKAQLGDRRLRVILFPLDITEQHGLRRDDFLAKIEPLIEQGSPLAEWTHAFLSSTFRKIETLHHGHEGDSTSLSLHDPMCVWYALTGIKQQEQWSINHGEDIRVETAGQWTRGACIVDRRDRKKIDGSDGQGDEIASDNGGWLSSGRGNRLDRCVGTPGRKVLASFLLETIFA